MHKSIPAGAAVLLRFIYRTETATPEPQCYDVIYGHNQDKLNKPITQWTLDEVEADGPRRTRAYKSSAAGAAQFMRDTLDKPGTLQDIEGEMGLTGKELFSPDLQDRMAFHLLKRRGYLAYMNGKLSRAEFGKRLAQEWASLPVLASTKNGKGRTVFRGQSYYANDGLNNSLVSADKFEAVLDEALAAGNDVPVPKAYDTAGSTVLVAGLLLGGLAAFWDWLSAIPCNLINLFCGS